MIDRELVKKHLRVFATDEDQLIDLYIAAAVDTAEQYLNRKLYAQSETVPEDDEDGLVLPPAVEAAILLIAGQLYEFRENVISGTIVAQLPNGAERLMWPYRRLVSP